MVDAVKATDVMVSIETEIVRQHEALRSTSDEGQARLTAGKIKGLEMALKILSDMVGSKGEITSD